MICIMPLAVDFAFLGVAASARDAPPRPAAPCGLGQPGNALRYDTKTGKVTYTGRHTALPH